ncbi:MAG TPA: hypothetical protein VMV82_06015 [Candidatus Dormibacteraeota bacterium]|nr:hypothetical protein [Candidatus Dormibacteraeota bacterium]
MAAALATLVATLVWTIAALPAPLALLHALVVGVFLTIAMGLLYQFVPVVAMAPLRLPYLAFLHLALALTGTLCIVGGFQHSDFALVRLGGSLHLVGIGIEAIVLGATLRGHTPPAPAAGAALSLLWLIATAGLGVWLADRFLRHRGVDGVTLFHALFGVAGFFGTLITAVSLRLLRMFERVNVERRTGMLALAVSLAAILAALGGRYGRYALLAASAAVAVNVVAIARVRNPAYQRETLLYALTSSLGAVAAAAAYTAGAMAAAVICAVWLYIGTAVVGYLQRIVPFIWWIRRSRIEGTRSIPTLGEMNDSRLGYAILVLWVLAGVVALLARQPLAAIFGLAAWIALLAQLARPFITRKAVDRASRQ